MGSIFLQHNNRSSELFRAGKKTMTNMRRIVLLVAGLALFTALPTIALSQNQLISGVVTDATGHAVVAASVVVQGTSRGTTTDADGKFKLNVPAKTGIVISATG